MANGTKEQHELLLKLLKEAINKDSELRKTYQIGERFRFIHERLIKLFEKIEAETHALTENADTNREVLAADEMLIYIYLYNAHGLNLKSWVNMLKPSVFYEYSINRPIYTDRSHIEGFIRSRHSKPHHGFITIAVKKADVLPGNENVQDTIGNPLVKVKEGSLDVTRIFSFTHNGHVYSVDSNGEIKLKAEQ